MTGTQRRECMMGMYESQSEIGGSFAEELTYALDMKDRQTWTRQRGKGRDFKAEETPHTNSLLWVGTGKVLVIEGRPVTGNQREQEWEEFKTTLKGLAGPDRAGVW